MYFTGVSISDPYPCEGVMTFKGGKYFKAVFVYRDIIDNFNIRSKVGRILVEHHVESNLPAPEFAAIRYWVRIGVKGPCPKRIKHLFNGVL